MPLKKENSWKLLLACAVVIGILGVFLQFNLLNLSSSQSLKELGQVTTLLAMFLATWAISRFKKAKVVS